METTDDMKAMKKNKSIILSAALALVALSSCDRHVPYTEIPFVYFDSPNISVYEDAGEIEIPVKVKGATSAFSLTFEAVDGRKKDAATGSFIPNGEKGVDYNIVDNDASIIRFNEGETEKIIKASIKDFTGTLTGNKDFTIKILNAGTEVSLGGFSSCKVTIIDNDHPLKSVLGAYSASGEDYWAGHKDWTLTLVADPDDYFKVWIDGILPDFEGDYLSGVEGRNHAVYATFNKINETTADLTSFSMRAGQKFADPYQDYDIQIVSFSGSSYSTSGSVVFTANSDGTGFSSSAGFGSYIPEANQFFQMMIPPVTLVKKQ